MWQDILSKVKKWWGEYEGKDNKIDEIEQEQLQMYRELRSIRGKKRLINLKVRENGHENPG